MGSPEFAVPPFLALCQAGQEVVGAVTQPDRPKGRGGRVQETPLKRAAMDWKVPVLTPERVRGPQSVEALRAFQADLFVVAAFGQILSEEILDIPPRGCVNIHASLLPAYRGASPVSQAILDGRESTGVTIMQMDAGIDTGDILLQRTIAIDPLDTAGSLGERLSQLGAGMIVEAVEAMEGPRPAASRLARCGLPCREQPREGASYARLLDKSMGDVDWGRDALSLERLVRGLNPWPGAFTRFRGKNLKIWEAEAVPEQADGAPGTVSLAGKGAFLVNTGAGKLRLLALQPEGKRQMSARDFLQGYPVRTGDLLGR